MKKLSTCISAFALSLLLGACAAPETKEADTVLLPPLDDEHAKRCVSLTRIASVRVLDSRSIEFKMHGGDVYINILPNTCPGLRPNKPFMYRTSLSVLCDLDLITLLDTGGFGIIPMGSCGLGRFRPVIAGGPATIEEDDADN
jgi:hypothetical protein